MLSIVATAHELEEGGGLDIVCAELSFRTESMRMTSRFSTRWCRTGEEFVACSSVVVVEAVSGLLYLGLMTRL